MTKQEFIKIKKSAKTPSFIELVNLKESDNTSKLINFMTLLHPNQSKSAQGSNGEVFGNQHYVFTIYQHNILRTIVESGKRTLYTI